MTDTPLHQRFADAMGHLLGPDFPADLGLAVSGGGDSMAMLYLAHNWTRAYGVRLWVVTVDHGLRAESASEARMVAEECAALGWPHATVRWRWDGRGNVQDAARRARLALIDRWRGRIRHVLFAHTEDDQAETFLIRLARGSGVDGLSGMPASRDVIPHALAAPDLEAEDFDGTLPPRDRHAAGFRIVRPCLGLGREDLRHVARTLKGRWVEDPSNEDRSYDRVRMRALLAVLRDEGITARGLAETAGRLSRAKEALTARLVASVDAIGVPAPLGQVRIQRDGLAALEEETRLRLLTSALCYVASAEYRPRASASEALLEQVLSGRGGTLHGAEVLVENEHLRIVREPAAVAAQVARPGALWDGQWVLSGRDGVLPENAVVRALGESGWRQIADRSALPLPHRAALGLCAVWSGDVLLSCPSLHFGVEIVAERYVLGRRDQGFLAFCLSH